MSIASHHAEWLSLVETSGPFLSMPVLSRAFANGLEKYERDQITRLRESYEEWLERGNREVAAHRAWVLQVLTELLEYPADFLLEGQAIPPGLEAAEPQFGETLRPDWVLKRKDSESRAQLLISLYPPSQKLDGPVAGKVWKATPGTRMMELLHATEVPLGLVTNGEHWMLVYAPRGETTGFASWYADLWMQEPITLRAFFTLLHLRRFFGVAQDDTLSALYAASAKDQQEVTEQLGYQVRQAVEILVQALDSIDAESGRQQLAGVSEKDIYDSALTVMMRLVFLFSAEERGLLLLGDALYDQHYAVSTLSALLRERADQHGEEVLERRHDAWCRLVATFRAVYSGVQHEAMRLPAYGGTLFDPDRYPFLEGRAKDTKWTTTPAKPLPINNRVVLHLLEALQILRVRVPGGGPTEARRLSFRALDVEQIGHVYEGLLDHTAKRAGKVVLGLAGTRDLEPEIPLSILEEKYARGVETLVEFVSDETGRQASTIRHALETKTVETPLALELKSTENKRGKDRRRNTGVIPLVDEHKLLIACGQDPRLVDKVKPFAALLRENSFGQLVVIPEGSVYVTRGSDRRSTGTHYTPRSLTEPIVQYTLEPLVYIGPAEGKPKEQWQLKSAKEILDLKICDMTMGSGAFLVQGCRYLAERLVEAWEIAEKANPGKILATPEGDFSEGDPRERLIPSDPAERLAVARRYVADRCLYGVDINPMAVEMAKLSLWLITLQRDRPFTFLDHALKCGDSLLGVSSVKQIENFSLRPGEQQITFATANLFRYVEEASAKRRALEDLPSNDHTQIETKTRLHAEAEAATAKVKALADALIAFELRDLDGDAYDEQRTIAADQAEVAMRKPLPEFQAYACDQLRGRPTFHWPVEFPEVLARGGFDAFAGNPPFLGGVRISEVINIEYNKVFQPKLWVLDAAHPPRPIFVQRRDWKHDLSKMDPITREETETLEMLYRHRLEFAVGHGVSVHAKLPEPNAIQAEILETEFVPRSEVEQQTSPTDADNPDLVGVVLDMKQLAEMPKADLIAGLRKLEMAYGAWIQRENGKLTDSTERLAEHQGAAQRAIQRCQRARDRVCEGIDLIANDSIAEDAFRFANRAMWYQRVRSTYARKVRKNELEVGSPVDPLDVPEIRSWRLFQLAFILLNLPSITNLDHPDRSHETDAVADLLWFATGGGKTEAYLGLTAYILGLRRLQKDIEGRPSDHGVAVLMRYTLRLLTLQQFQRAAALLCACEIIRKTDTVKWGTTHFRLGLWVGARATPNSLKQAAEALRQSNFGGRPSGGGTPHQLVSCPWCGREIKPLNVKVYEPPNDIGRCIIYCGDATGSCEFSEARAPKEGLPVMVVDEDIYRRPPSLLIATVDKFAQMPWRGETQQLFGQVNGLCLRHGFMSPEIEADDTGNHIARGALPRVQKQTHGRLRPPDLIIQDELHLISGPLGSMVALYEAAVDELCTWTVNGKRVRPKVIASTATIRRASDQIQKLFLRKLEVFPPQGTSIKDSFFALQRPERTDYPGRRYLGICAFGRRYPVAMIRVYVALLAAAQTLYEKYDRLADPWMTLAGYFNSIRELAGTRRLVEDDIRYRVRDADQRGFAKRMIRFGAVEELTSRKSGTDIPRILERLDVVFDKAEEKKREDDIKAGKQASPRPYDAILATNMISVGVDIDRLGLMVVAGQPKTTSEYIQATSRVGRSVFAPGLVVTVFNWARPRDLSHYESFEHYHETFYKHVEALSVTPFSARALDRGVSGVLTALVRLAEGRLNANVMAGQLQDTDPAMPGIIDRLVSRAEKALGDPTVGILVREMLMARRDYWLARVRNQTDHVLGYRDAPNAVVGLLQPPGVTGWELFTCLNSLRDVEGTVNLILDSNPSGLRATS